MKVALKVCGMKYPANVLEVGSLKPDYMGFIFYEKSPRFVGKEFWVPMVFDQAIKRVGVFVEADVDFVVEKARKYSIDFVQLHGDETPAYCDSLKDNGIDIIKVFRVDDQFDFMSTRDFRDVANYFLFDTRGSSYGGNARTFDWRKLTEYDQSVPFFLSGGISPENVSNVKLLADMNIHAIDVNSGVEVTPGIKDVRLIREVINELKRIEA